MTNQRLIGQSTCYFRNISDKLYGGNPLTLTKLNENTAVMKKIRSAPTVVYPSSDGEPMAETERHRKALEDLVDMVDGHFRDVPDIHVSGNLLLYYEEGDPHKVISPDVFMVRGVSKKELRTYKTWEQSPTLDFVIELASPSTFTRDFKEKKEIYAKILQVQEYYIYDPYHEIEPSFVGFRLIDGEYEEIAFIDDRLPSVVLGLELGEREGALRLYNPNTRTWLEPSRARAAQAEIRAQDAETRAEDAETRALEAERRAQEEAQARQNVEAELAKAREALKRLQK